jgi:hypothetical protein
MALMTRLGWHMSDGLKAELALETDKQLKGGDA